MDYRNIASAQGSRGLRTNNPLNLKTPSFNYEGEVGDDGLQAIFSSVEYGLRAAALDLYTAYYVHGRTTIADILNVFAPSYENDTTAYINTVASFSGINGYSTFEMNGTNLFKIIRAMLIVELGSSYAAMITDGQVKQGINMAGKTAITIASSGIGGILLTGVTIYLLLKH